MEALHFGKRLLHGIWISGLYIKNILGNVISCSDLTLLSADHCMDMRPELGITFPADVLSFSLTLFALSLSISLSPLSLSFALYIPIFISPYIYIP